MEKIKKQRGIVFFTTLILLGLAVLVSAAVLLMILRDVYTVKRVQSGTQAYYLAEAGVEKAINTLYGNFSWTGPETLYVPAGSPNSYTVRGIAYPGNPARKLIESTGTVPGNGIIPATTRKILVQVQNNIPPAFDYMLFSTGVIGIAGGGTLNGGTHAIHSNSNLDRGWFFIIPLGAIVLVKLDGQLTVNGTVSAVGEVHNVLNRAIINGAVTDNAAALSPLSALFDSNFFGRYATHASTTYDMGGTGTKVFNNDNNIGVAGPNNTWITYVNGNVTFRGACAVTGCVVAKGNIRFDNGSCTQIQPASKDKGYAAFLCQGSLWMDPAYVLNVNGMVYADNLSVDLSLGNGTLNVTGSFYTGGLTIFTASNMNWTYVRPHPEYLDIPAPITVLSWTEQ